MFAQRLGNDGRHCRILKISKRALPDRWDRGVQRCGYRSVVIVGPGIIATNLDLFEVAPQGPKAVVAGDIIHAR